MPRNRVPSSEPPATTRWRSRHGRGARGPVTGPHLPMLDNRIDAFDMTVASTADYLKGIWPRELADVHFEVAATPIGVTGEDGVDRWHVDHARRRVLLYRVPIQRLAKLHRNDDLHRRMYVEGCVFRAVAELLGKDPWDLAPERFRHF
ncbi:metallopeptidase family protein [Leifsonia poae]|uniref:metallopeptidase family protein n=1 Tax=Leifsonia poae TaxID=110933 RepID=UPI001CBFEE50|nr:metallopeptidase family protein [Leifsonia poae]